MLAEMLVTGGGAVGNGGKDVDGDAVENAKPDFFNVIIILMGC